MSNIGASVPGSRPVTRLPLLEGNAADARQLSDGLARMMRGEILGVVLRGAFPAEGLVPVVSRLEKGECRLVRHGATHYQGVSYGGILVLADENLNDYLAEGAGFRDACSDLFAGTLDYQTRIEELLGAMAGGRRVTVPTGSDGRPYIASSIRGIVEGGQIDLHCENETIGFPGMRHLSTLIDTTDQLSFYLTLAAPESGGIITISRLRHGEGAGKALLQMERKSEQTLRAVAPYGEISPPLGAGDLLIFDAGRSYHRVTPVSGPRMRWTMGGFLAFSKNHKTIYYWG